MPTKNLTDRTIKAIKPTAARVEYFDAKLPGLALRVTPAGVKTWTLMYRHRGRRRRLTLGTLDALTLAQARELAKDKRHDVSKGVDVATVKQDGRTADTIADLADLYIEKWARPRKRSWKADRNLLDHRVLPTWKHRAIVDITRQDCRQLVEGVAEKGAPIVANRVAALLSKMFAFALDRDLVKASPAVRLPRPGQERQRDRVLSDADLRTLWLAWDALPAPMAAFYRLRLLTAQRGGEVASMRWSDVDLTAGWWTIPAASAKNKLAHRVPLNASAVKILVALLATADDKAVYVLGATERTKGAGARGKRQQSEAARTFGVDNFRGHDLRRTAATVMASGGIPRLVVGKILNHQEPGVTKVYDRATYDAEKSAALTWWDAKLAGILEPRGAADVLAFVGVRESA
jgi:integrase